jgi:deoxyribonuclease-2
MVSQRKRGGGTIAFQNRLLWQALSRTDLILAPPGHTRDHARALLRSSHQTFDTDSPSQPTPAAKPKPPAKPKKS